MKNLKLFLAFWTLVLTTSAFSTVNNWSLNNVAVVAVGNASAPAVITKDTTASQHTTGSTNSFTIAQNALTKGYVTVVASYFYFADNTVTATYAGHSMTLLKIQQRAGGVSDFCAVFGLALDALSEDGAGTKTIVVTLAGGGGSFALDCGCTTWSGVNQSATFTVAGGTNSDASPTCTIATGAATDVVVSGVEAEGSAATITCGDTLLWSFNGGMCSGASQKAGTGGSVTSTWTLSGARDWATVSVCLTL